MRLLVTGAKGQVGIELCTKAHILHYDVIELDLPELDITDADAVFESVTQSQPDIVINAAAYTEVDMAEMHKERAFAVNRDGVEYLARTADHIGIPFLHISTDFVYDGNTSTPYTEEVEVCPLSVYGKSKAAGEAVVRERIRQYVILRTSWVYSTHGTNFVKTMLQLGDARREIRVVADQYGSPTSASDIADTIITVIDRIDSKGEIPWGTYHYCGGGITTWHGFAREIFALAYRRVDMIPPDVVPIPTTDYRTPARRPMYSVLNCTKIEQTFELKRPLWQLSLAKVIDKLLTSSS